MKPIPRLLLIGSALLILTARHVAEVPVPPDTGVIEAIHDGDTLSLVDGRHVRLIAEDSPEIGQGSPGTAARDWLALTCPPGSTVRLVPDSHHPADSYGRSLSWVAFGDPNQHEPLNIAIVRAGHAYAWRPTGHRVDRWDEMVAAEAEARAARRGVWAAGDGGGERPWEYRARIKREHGR